MNFTVLSLIVLSFLSGFTSCYTQPDKSGVESTPIKSDPVVLRPLRVGLTEGNHQAVKVAESKISSGERFQAAQFVDARHGWARSNKSLYMTSDGGKNWEPIALNLSPDSNLSSFFFINDTKGWLTIVNRVNSAHYGMSNSSRIMTSSDGGKSWTEQASFPDEVDLSCIRFLNVNDGIATGFRVIEAQPLSYELFAIRTDDGGKSWKNIAENLALAIQDENGFTYDFAHAIHWSSPSNLLLLTRGGKIVSSSDQGETWNLLVQFKDQRPEGFISSTGYRSLAISPEGNISVVAGAEGTEGFWGDFVSKDKQDTWLSHELLLVPIRDAVFLSETEVVACGLEIQAYDEKTKSRKPSMGVLLHSTNGGKTWAAISRIPSNQGFVSLSKITDKLFYVIGGDGEFVRFDLR
jgi:photosystem II stability/assembly factor-like uncharacterized protein